MAKAMVCQLRSYWKIISWHTKIFLSHVIGCLGPVNGPTAEVKTISMGTGLAALKIIIIKTEDCKVTRERDGT